MSAVHFNKGSFQKDVENGSGVAVVDFWAPWCGPCKMLGPIIEELAEDLSDNVLIGKVNVDDEMELAQQFGVSTIPTLILFKDGDEVERLVGLRPKDSLEEWIKENI